MQSAATPAASLRPRHRPRGGSSPALHPDAAAHVVSASFHAYDGALPELVAGAVPGRIDRNPPSVSADLALAMAASGFAIAGSVPKTASPHDWILRAIETTVAAHVPVRTHAPLSVGFFAGDDGHPAVALEIPVDGAHVVALQPAVGALRSQEAAIAACSIINQSFWLMGPDRMFYEVSSLMWQGEEDESSVAREYAPQGEAYEGITRAQWDHVWPKWTRRASRAARHEGLAKLRRLANEKTRAGNFARALLVLAAAHHAARRNPFGTSLADAIGLDSTSPWGVPFVWSRQENLTAMVLDQMVDLAMQCSCDMSVVAMRLPDSKDVRAMRAFRNCFEASLQEFAAASALCQVIKSLENKRCTKS